MSKHKNKGQALVEFVIILPIFIFMIFVVIDIGKILTAKTMLESELDDVILEYQNVKNTEDTLKNLELNNQNITLKVSLKDQKYTEYTLEKQMDIITPGLNIILGNPAIAKAKRVVNNE